MPKLDIVTFLLQGMPESIALVAAVFAFAKIKFCWKMVIIIGLLYGLTAFTVRLLPISFGIHAVILILALSVYVTVLSKGSFLPVLRASAIGFVILVILEVLTAYIFSSLLKESLESLAANKIVWVLIGWPQIIILCLIAVIKNRKTMHAAR